MINREFESLYENISVFNKAAYIKNHYYNCIKIIVGNFIISMKVGNVEPH